MSRFRVRFDDGDTEVIERGDKIEVGNDFVSIKDSKETVAVFSWGSLAMLEKLPGTKKDCC